MHEPISYNKSLFIYIYKICICIYTYDYNVISYNMYIHIAYFTDVRVRP